LKKLLVETIVDWRPFDYYTFEAIEGNSNMRQTYKLEPISDGTKTRLHFTVKMISPPLPRFIRRPMLKMMLSKIVRSHCQAMTKFISKDIEAEVNTPAVQMTA